MKDGDSMLNKVLFTLSSTSWIFVIYGISEEMSFVNGYKVLTGIVLLLIPFILTLIWLINTIKFSSKESIQGDCQNIEEANNDFLANYLGYFFIGIGLEKFETLITIYVIIFIFTCVSQNQYYNPLLLLFGYKYYRATTSKGTSVFVISKKDIRNPKDADFSCLRRISNMSYIDVGGNK